MDQDLKLTPIDKARETEEKKDDQEQEQDNGQEIDSKANIGSAKHTFNKYWLSNQLLEDVIETIDDYFSFSHTKFNEVVTKLQNNLNIANG